ncbi:type I DNA topoisomerase [Rubinisphaera margarita]|uniref:type I DNA topoisomerase n=1 Tax=Rubinisphaera margarita TaxID=2909586 RepID=UPI001EE7C804|nr:type I DNA topoisomerase [Rubinisphaera margarita]MCG6154788.1 type I DNA topoisomerase [Rubinisphaera margarita]
MADGRVRMEASSAHMVAKNGNYKALVIVESPAKAKKIGSFLGSDYIVRASVGHVRDLPAKAADIPSKYKKESWATLGVNPEKEFEPLYVVPSEKKKLIKELKDLLQDAQELIIATDEDREGESIGWHLVQLLEPKVSVRRMVFSEITKSAIQEAINNTRDINEDLVEAQETRRVLDRLYGYTLSPLLWKKIARGLSAGRVQSVAVRLLVQRELERLAFHSATYWDLRAALRTGAGGQFEAILHSVDDKRLATGKDFDEATGKLKPGADVLLLNQQEAESLQERLLKADWSVGEIEERMSNRKPPAPFITSSLQQEANRKLNMTARQTMQTAQRLYENGYITYMRTDSVALSSEAVQATRGRIQDLYGDNYLSDSPRQYTGKSKNAQEAHEAIRPSGTEMRTAEELRLTGVEARLYALIWKRTMACQMAEARLKFLNVTVEVEDAKFRATGRQVVFPGFFRAYVEGSDDPEAALDDRDSMLPDLKEQEPLNCSQLDPVGHETKPPARFTEASLVRKLEEEGIGRPSTYASILSTIQDRGYVRKDSNQLIPTFTAMAVTRLLEENFPNLVDTQFTAGMEQTLDDISNGQAQRVPYLGRFYGGDDGLVEQVKTREEKIDPRKACTLEFAGLDSSVRVGRYGPYLEKEENGEQKTASLPQEISPADVNQELAQKLFLLKEQGPQSIGMHPEEGLPIFVLSGPFGPYLQLGEQGEDGAKPKRVSIPKNIDPTQIELSTAIKLMELPRTLGQHPEDGKVVKAGIGRFGPYVQHSGKYKGLPKDVDVLTVGLDLAVELLKQARTKEAPKPIRELGKHPEDEEVIGIFEGRYGPYVKHGKINATVPKDTDLESVTLAQALEWIEAKAAKTGKKTTKKATKKKATKKKSAKKKATKKKSTKKKKTDD